jgi:predicted dehydrogenase
MSSRSSVVAAENAPRIALVGCGAITEWFYAPALARHSTVRKNLVLVDRDEARVKKLATKWSVTKFAGDYREVLDEVDGAILAVPTHLHHPIAMEFLARGIPVLCEKPLAQSAPQAREMVNLAEQTGAALAANYTRRLYASFGKIKEMLASRTLGEPLSIEYLVGEEFKWPTVSGFYFDTATSPRGVLLDGGSHVMDIICWWLGGKPELRSCQNDSFGGIDAVTHVQFVHGRCDGTVKLSWLGKSASRYTIKCEAGTIEGGIYDFGSVGLTTPSGHKKVVHLKANEKYYSDFGYKMVDNFIDVIAGRARPLVSGRDVLDSMEFIDECYESASRFDMPWYDIAVDDDGR